MGYIVQNKTELYTIIFQFYLNKFHTISLYQIILELSHIPVLLEQTSHNIDVSNNNKALSYSCLFEQTSHNIAPPLHDT